MVYLGLDLSLQSSGISCINDEGTIIFCETLHVKQVGVERLFFLKNKLKDLLDTIGKQDNVFACIESPAYHETGRLFELGTWAGLVMVELFERGVPFIGGTPLQVKKFISKVGKNTGKQTVILDVYKRYGIELRQDDLADSFVMAQIALNYYKMFVLKQDLELPSFQEEVLQKINKSETVANNCCLLSSLL